ncbi:MAG TPA: hypothetical protein PK120_04875 [Syntrophales bacterium]|nr:hypothetical protein [Syntrophales bacterium]
MVRPAKVRSRRVESTQVTTALNPASMNERARTPESLPQRGKRHPMPAFFTRSSRYLLMSSRKISPKATFRMPDARHLRRASSIEDSYASFEQGQGMKTSCRGQPIEAACRSIRIRRTPCMLTRSKSFVRVQSRDAISQVPDFLMS